MHVESRRYQLEYKVQVLIYGREPSESLMFFLLESQQWYLIGQYVSKNEMFNKSEQRNVCIVVWLYR